MERILKDNTNKIWVNTSNQIIKEIPFSEITAVNGKIVEYIGGNVNNIGGFSNIWYDSVGNNNLIQNNATFQYRIMNSGDYPSLKSVDINGITKNSYMALTTGISYYSCIMVVRHTGYLTMSPVSNGGGNGLFFGANANVKLYISDTTGANKNGIRGDTWINGVKNNNYTSPLIIGNIYIIGVNMYSLFPITANLIGMYTGYFRQGEEILHIALFNKIQKDAEMTYSMNALKTKYNVI